MIRLEERWRRSASTLTGLCWSSPSGSSLSHSEGGWVLLGKSKKKSLRLQLSLHLFPVSFLPASAGVSRDQQGTGVLPLQPAHRWRQDITDHVAVGSRLWCALQCTVTTVMGGNSIRSWYGPWTVMVQRPRPLLVVSAQMGWKPFYKDQVQSYRS